jgi:hypothetical protein
LTTAGAVTPGVAALVTTVDAPPADGAELDELLCDEDEQAAAVSAAMTPGMTTRTIARDLPVK